MPDLTVVEGGAQPRNWDHEISKQNFEEFVIELLRRLAGAGGPYQLTDRFFHFLEHAQKSGVPLGPVFDGAIGTLYKRAFDHSGAPDYESDRKDLVRDALHYAAEAMSSDGFARARQSKRNRALSDAIETVIIGREERSRKNGRSYIANLTKDLDPLPRVGVGRLPKKNPRL